MAFVTTNERHDGISGQCELCKRTDRRVEWSFGAGAALCDRCLKVVSARARAQRNREAEMSKAGTGGGVIVALAMVAMAVFGGAVGAAGAWVYLKSIW